MNQIPDDVFDSLEQDAKAPVKATNEEVKEIGFLVKRAIELKNELENIDAIRAKYAAELAGILEKDLPEAMDSAGSQLFQDKDSGKKVTVKDDIYASISKDNAPKAHAWLREHNHEDIIKNLITVPLNKGSDNVATEIVKTLHETFGVAAERTESVHASTLKAFCKEQLASGVEMPADLFGIFIRRVATIK